MNGLKSIIDSEERSNTKKRRESGPKRKKISTKNKTTQKVEKK